MQAFVNAALNAPSHQKRGVLRAMSASIFISYRRQDSAGHADRLAERLKGDYDEETVFFDKSNIHPGDLFPEVLKAAVQNSEIVLAIIGRGWLSCKTDNGKRRLDDKKDWVREELRRAGKPRDDVQPRLVIPLLVEGVSMPGKMDLPPPLKYLAKCNAIHLRGEGKVFEAEYRVLLRCLDNRLQITKEERARDWVYDDIAKHLEVLSQNQRRNVASELTALDGGSSSAAFSARALAKRFYKLGPSALTSLGQALVFDHALRPVLERLKDYWVTTEAADKLAQTWKAQEPNRISIVQGTEMTFTPKCVIQKASNSANPWRMHVILSDSAQPSSKAVISIIHEHLRRTFAHSLRRKGLPDLEEPRVTQFLQRRLEQRALEGEPIAVQLDETGAADELLIRSIQATFPHLRLLVLVPGEQGIRDLEERFVDDIENERTSVVTPEAAPGDENTAADAYYKIVERFPPA